MSTTTNNYGFIKPEKADPADITSTNQNWDTIDVKLQELTNQLDQVDIYVSKIPTIPNPTIGDDGKFLRVVNNTAQWVTVNNAEGVEF